MYHLSVANGEEKPPVYFSVIIDGSEDISQFHLKL
jgi:hypothetical protein